MILRGLVLRRSGGKGTGLGERQLCPGVSEGLERFEGLEGFEVGLTGGVDAALEAKGWVSATWERSEKGKRARYYRLTPRGRKQLAEEQSKWEAFSRAMELILNPVEQEGQKRRGFGNWAGWLAGGARRSSLPRSCGFTWKRKPRSAAGTRFFGGPPYLAAQALRAARREPGADRSGVGNGCPLAGKIVAAGDGFRCWPCRGRAEQARRTTAHAMCRPASARSRLAAARRRRPPPDARRPRPTPMDTGACSAVLACAENLVAAAPPPRSLRRFRASPTAPAAYSRRYGSGRTAWCPP